ncbi:flagellar basal body-associated FliL family protein [Tropicimonas sp.]|uniref:flagellar basal body-associated FliL family protein n=1 Tax=Tropicimonas sp. TaxID=2067044 RepID=UPI003A8993EB
MVLALFGAGIGAGAGTLLRPDLAEVADTREAADEAGHEGAPRATDTASAGSHSEQAAEGHREIAPDGHETGTASASAGTEFVKLNNQFIVPVLARGRVSAMVVISLSLEARTGGSEAIYSQEPRLRDAFLRVMFDHANAGGFDDNFTMDSKLEPLRKALDEAGKKQLGDLVVDVLVTDIARQDV